MRTRKAGVDQVNTYIDHRIKELIPAIEALTPFKAVDRKKGKNGVKGWKAIAVEETRRLKAHYPDEVNDDGSPKPESDRTYSTCLRQITALKKALKGVSADELADPVMIGQFRTIVTHLGDAISEHFTIYTSMKNITYAARVEDRSKSSQRIEINLEPFIEQAHTILSVVANGGDMDWREVTCAIALVSGRRMAEILASGKFTKVSDYELSFQGQLKGKEAGIITDIKGNKIRANKTRFDQMRLLKQIETDSKFILLIDHVFTIPTLVKADLIVAGIEYLAEQGKRLSPSEDPEIVNRRWSKPLSEQIKKSWVIVPDDVWQAVDPKDKMTFHKLRGAYFIGVMGATGGSFNTMKDQAETILGDKNLSAIENYDRFELAPNTKTRV